MIIYAREKGITPGKEIAAELIALFDELSQLSGEKELVFDSGDYIISAENCKDETLVITNTVGDGEFDGGEKPHTVKTAICIKNVKNLKISGNGARFTVDGKATNIAVCGCENIELCDFAVRVKKPDFHELRVVDKTAFSVDFELCGGSEYEKNSNGRGYSFVGSGYKSDFYENRVSWSYIHKISGKNPDSVVRTKHPFFGALSIKETAKNRFRLAYPSTVRFAPGDIYGVYNARRQHNGIFVDKSKNVALQNVKQHFNYGLAFVAQDSENISLNGLFFAPEEGSGRHIASCADFIQLCMCKGQASVTNSFFCGAGDDVLNVHGIHFSVERISGNAVTVKFMHPQSHGFNPLHEGDEIEYVNPGTLLPEGRAVIKASALVDEYTVELVVSNTQGVKPGMVIEDTAMCPDLYFANNKMTRIITRGLLITTRGKVMVENNDFINTSMDSILISDDAKNWFESGRVEDVTVRGNRFGACGAYNIEVLPENGGGKMPVHKNIVIEDNAFASPENGGISLNSAENIIIRNNTFPGSMPDGFIKAKNTVNMVADGGREKS